MTVPGLTLNDFWPGVRQGRRHKRVRGNRALQALAGQQAPVGDVSFAPGVASSGDDEEHGRVRSRG
eukprot:2808571-Prorocentrum_lima.AAC.1